ncbi:MAG: hypothetical protein K8S99_14880 [Planctomycetes bacterium]|nr:hypothetical protein [Planctomycetota bacterium]
MNMNPTLLSDHAVWQRDRMLPILGDGTPGAAVSLTFRGKTWTTRADAHGKWGLCIGPFNAGGPGDVTLSIEGGPATVTRDVLVGDVWVCSGQSNMVMALRHSEGGEEEMSRATRGDIRLMTIPNAVADAPAPLTPEARWRRCSPEVAGDFSAVGYWFGLRLAESLGVPIGLIQAAVGATPAESWTPRYVMEGHHELRPIMARWRQSLADFPDPEKRYEQAFKQWDHDADLAEREGRPIPGPHPKLIPPGHPWTPAGLFHGMIAPLTSTPIRGVAWYQGAGAPDRGFQYRMLFRELIRAWRWWWHDPAMPFLFVQEAEFGPRRDQPCEHSWAELREAQAMALAEPSTAMAVGLGTGDATDVHPKCKRPLGERLALAARAVVYGENIPHTGPVLESMSVEGDRLRLRFKNTHGGLRTSDNQPPRGFAVSPGCDDFTKGNRNFVWADARIEGDDLILHAPSVPHPVATRHAWAQNPDSNLTDSTGLPAAPFRTDDWPGVTVSNF